MHYESCITDITIMKIKSILLSALACASAATMSAAEAPRYIFYFIGDGMGMGHVMSAECYNRTVRGNNERLLMMQFPVASAATTFSASSPITDSAAAGTALATGHKTQNGMIGMNPDTVAVSSMAVSLDKLGYGIGVITTGAPDDATPGAFFAHVPNRSMYYEIGRDAANSSVSFLGGSNLRGLRDREGNPTDLAEIIEKSGMTIVRGTEALSSVKTDRVLLLNTDSLLVNDLGYAIDSVPGIVTLPAMTQACLDHLEKQSPDKFFMMIEDGSIDHAAHSNDGGAVVKEIISFQDAISIAYDFYLAHPDETLIVITADHDTGGMALGNQHVPYDAHLKYLDYQHISKDRFSDFCKNIQRQRRIFTWDDMREILEAKMGFWKGVPVTERQTEELKETFDRCFVNHESGEQKSMYASYNDFVVKVFSIMDSFTGIGWTATHHTGGMVPVYAVGVDASRFNGLNDNTQIPIKIMEIVTGR